MLDSAHKAGASASAWHEHNSRSHNLLLWHNMTDRIRGARCGHLAHKSQHGDIASMADIYMIVLLFFSLFIFNIGSGNCVFMLAMRPFIL